MILRSLANKASDPRDDQQSTMQQPEASVRQKEEEERVREMEEPLQHIETKSQSTRSRSSKQSSRSSTVSCAAIKTRAKADAARARVSYAEKEASMMKQKAELDASLYVLQVERTAAAALAEAVALEEAVESERRELHRELNTGTQPLSPVQRTHKIENGGDVYQRRKGPRADAGSSDSEGQEVGSRQREGAGQTGSSWRRIVLLILAITIHNIPEGLAVGVGFGAIGKTSSATFESARNLAIGIGIQNFPEGLAVSLPLRGAGMSTWKAFWYGQLSGMVEPIAGLLGAVAMVLAEPLLPYALAFAAGAMVYVVVDDIIPEAQLSGNGKLASWTSILGFVVMMSLDVGLG
ncbi:zinc transporter ZIP11-like isoform X1 [Coregonus clupeaformis]|uniref:zinc transporter ZIP11-like isoform X1 n=1 Tax=Coregonus clupeaformis TaxID=59861 RepID=UPI001BDF8D2D|nr:zinc transporter ZIP11-like isoform X1 [Coregonus clupeaformis]